MARVDYFEIETAIRDIIKANPETADIDVLIEERPSLGDSDFVLIEPERRDAPDEIQTLSAGTRTRYELEISVWCYGYGMERDDALKRRDDLVSKVEIILMGNRKLNSGGKEHVTTLWLRGGEFDFRQGAEGAGFISGAQIEVICDVTAIT